MPGDPHTPEEYGAEARRIVDEGGTMTKARGLCEHVGRRVATVAETRSALGLCGVPA